MLAEQEPHDPPSLIRVALRLARRGFGRTSPNPMVGAVLVRGNQIIGRGYHRGAGRPHAEIEAIEDARARGHKELVGSSLYVTLEPCSTHGRTPPCTDAILRAGIGQVFVGTTDPNPIHSGRGFDLLRNAGVEVATGIREEEVTRLNEAFNHWIVTKTPFVTVKAALSLDGKIATVSGQSKWITGHQARAFAMKLRRGADAILVGVNTVLMDNPRLTVRRGERETGKRLRRVILDGQARTPPDANVLGVDPSLVTIVIGEAAPGPKVRSLEKRATILRAPLSGGRIDLRWLLAHLGGEGIQSLLVDGGGEVNASFLFEGLAHRIAFFYGPTIIGGRSAPGAVGGRGARTLSEVVRSRQCEWRRLGSDFLLTARVDQPQSTVLSV